MLHPPETAIELEKTETFMPRYMAGTHSPDGLNIPIMDDEGASACGGGGHPQCGRRRHLGAILRVAGQEADFLHLRRPFPGSHPPGRPAERTPRHRITEVRVLDPYFYH